MKNISTIISKITVLLSMVLLFNAPGYAQVPSDEIILLNDTQISPNEVQFDIYLKSTNNTSFPTGFHYGNGQFRVNFNAAIRNGANTQIYFEVIDGSTELTNTAQAPNTVVNPTLTQSFVRIPARLPVAYDLASIISPDGNGTRLCRFRMISRDNTTLAAVPFVSGSLANLTLSTQSPGACITAYVIPAGTVANCSPQVLNNTLVTNAPLNPPVPLAYNVTGTGSYCQGGVGLPVGLDGSEVGVTYTLYKDAVAQVPTVIGTGSAITFGNQTIGTYTVEGTNGSGTAPMTGSAVITETAPVAVSVTASPDQNNVCQGTSVTFTATPTNGGTPSYQWYVNTVSVGTNQATYTYTPADNDVVYVIMTSSLGCTTGNPATSATTTMTVNPSVSVSVSIAPDQNNICAGTSVTFTATPTNGGSPSYQWYLNGSTTGADQDTYTFTPSNGDQVYVIMNSSLGGCLINNPATSATTTMIVNSNPVSVSIVADQNPVCAGSMVTYTATPVNGGFATYQWYVDGNPAGVGLQTFTLFPVNGTQVYVVVTSDLTCTTNNPATSNTITMTVNTPLAVSVTASPDQNNVCAGTSVTFTASPTNGGTPTYQWYRNGSPAGTNSATYAFVPNNNDAVYVVMTSGLTCVTGNPATSGTTTMVVNPLIPVSVSAVADQNNICQGTSVTFTATPVNGGASPTYQWYRNSTPVGGSTNTYTFVPNNNDQVYVVMTSNLGGCVSGNPATSATTTMAVYPPLAASVTATPDQNNVCQGTSVTFTATPANGGTTPAYQWYLNSAPVGTNSATYTFTPNNGDQVYVVMTSSITVCISGSPATSSTTTMVVNPLMPVSVTASPDQNNVCQGTSVTFTAIPVNGGTPTYQWYRNGSPAGANQATYTFTPNNGDQVYVVMTSGLSCTSGNPATSAITTMVVNPPMPVSVALTVSDNNICNGTSVTFTATPTNGGAPIYHWYLNGASTGTNQPTYSYVPNNGDQVYVVMTSSLSVCVTGNPATSNVITMVTFPGAAASVTIVAGSNDICEGTEVVFTATPNVGGNPSYQWKVNGANAGTNNFQFSYIPEDEDEVWVVMTSDLVCVSNNPATSNIIEMIVNPTVEVEAAIETEDNNICAGEMMYFTSSVDNGGNAPVYEWQVNGDPAGTNDPEFAYVPEDGDVVQLILTSSLFCTVTNPVASNEIEAMVNALPVVTWEYEYDEMCTNWEPVELTGGLPEGGEYSGTGVVDNMFAPGVVGVGVYTLTYTYTDGFGCSGTADFTVTVDECIGTANNVLSNSSVIIFPNPTNNKLFVKNSYSATPTDIRIFNTVGSQIFETADFNSINQFGINVRSLSSGTYTLQLIFEDGVVNKTFIVR